MQPAEEAPHAQAWQATAIAALEADHGDALAEASPGLHRLLLHSAPERSEPTFEVQPAQPLVADDAPNAMSNDVPLSFMPVPAKASWLGRKSLLALSGVFGLGLLLQLGVMERDRLAARAPALRPVLAFACDVLGCSIAAPHQIESIAIDSSAFTSVKTGIYKLSVTLKNSATIELATPALELTLSDLQDQTLLRRVILPAEFAGASSIAAGSELSLNLPLAVKPEALAGKVTGYKLLAFYP